MIPLYDVDQVRAAERAQGPLLSDGVLMQRAVAGLTSICAQVLGPAISGARVVVVAGGGDNGADALWAGARLAARGARVDAVQLADRLHDAGAGALRRSGGRLHRWSDDPASGERLIRSADLVLDGLVGIGRTGALRGAIAEAARIVADTEAIVVAVDIPSGVDADTGAVDGIAVRADLTVTFGARKLGLSCEPGRSYAGTVQLVPIGLELAGSAATQIESADVAVVVPPPGSHDHKYSRGVVGVVAGSAEYPGAAVLCVDGARRGNAGMVMYLDRLDACGAAVLGAFPDVVVDASMSPRVDAWVCGPGFPGSDTDATAVAEVLGTGQPVVLDAGAFTVLAAHEAVRSRIVARVAPTVITPHEGEFERMFPGLLAESGSRVRAARSAAATLRAIVVLKGATTLVAGPSGRLFVDGGATADLATAGSGDVLSGLTGALLAGAWARGVRDADAILEVIAAAVWLHGTAGRLAAGFGPIVATDIAAALPAAMSASRSVGMVT